MNFHKDISQVMVSNVDYPSFITNHSNIGLQQKQSSQAAATHLLVQFQRHAIPGTLGYWAFESPLQRSLDPMGVCNCATAYYPFTLAIESSFEEDYATEKLWSAFERGVVPVVAGTPNTRFIIPAGSTIFIEDFANPEAGQVSAGGGTQCRKAQRAYGLERVARGTVAGRVSVQD